MPQPDADDIRSLTEARIAHVIQDLERQHPDRLREMLRKLRARVPQLERVSAERTDEGRHLLQFKDAAFDEPVPARFTSDGTLEMLGHLALLHGPEPSRILGIETPERNLHPRFLYEFAEECRQATLRTQILLTTHSPSFLNALEPKEVWVIDRNEEGYTEARRTSDIDGVKEHKDAGAQLGSLWTEGYLESPTIF